MAFYTITFTPDGKIKKELSYKGKIFSYTMIPDDYGKTSDKKCFKHQVADKFPNETDEVMEAIEELGFADEDEIEDCLTILSSYED
ncbi:hypothetical protein ABFV99_13985 [Cytobacillus horneckiae]|uniref:hypothetical protein n=1 Tax=Cytobacillus horneckiae TaxID=549687 RepID=UPI0034CD4609